MEFSKGVEDNYITNNNEATARVSNPAKDRVASLNALVGVVPEEMREMSLDDIRKEKITTPRIR